MALPADSAETCKTRGGFPQNCSRRPVLLCRVTRSGVVRTRDVRPQARPFARAPSTRVTGQPTGGPQPSPLLSLALFP